MDFDPVVRLIALLLEGIGLYETWRGVTALRRLGARLEGDHVIHARPGVYRMNAQPYVSHEELEKSEDMIEQRLDERDRDSRARDAQVLQLLTHRAGRGLILIALGVAMSTLSEEIACALSAAVR